MPGGCFTNVLQTLQNILFGHMYKVSVWDSHHKCFLNSFLVLPVYFREIIVRRAGLLLSQQDFEWRWSVPLFKCLTVLEFSFILFDLCLLITFFNFIMNYVPIVTFWIFTYHKIWILSIMFCFIWSYWIIYFLACFRADSRLAPSQWETSLQINVVSHWLGANLESALCL